MSHRSVAIVTLSCLLAACSGDDGPPLTDATTLSCPVPGALPFRLGSSGFHGIDTTIAAKNPRVKDEASDVLGNPGGAVASIYLDDTAAPAAGGADTYAGIKARTQDDTGLTEHGLAGETVSLWNYDMASAAWSSIGTSVTDDGGHYAISGTGVTAGVAQPVYAMLEADGSCAEHLAALYPAGTKVIVTDIDGTLTLDDGQLLSEIADATYVPKMMGAANTLMQLWATKGYPIIYLTARPHILRDESRTWLEQLQFPPGAMITTNGTTSDAGDYKTIWLHRIVSAFGWSVEAAYGNAVTDIAAYANAQIPLDRTFIVGPEGGMGGTTAIPNLDFSTHITDFVMAQPNN